MRGIVIVPFAATLLLVAAVHVGGGGHAVPANTARAQEAVTVSAQGDTFNPDVLTVAAGTTVVWSNNESDPTNRHNTIAQDGSWKSSDFAPGETWAFTFTVPGEYPYYCDLHEGMYGTVIVQ